MPGVAQAPAYKRKRDAWKEILYDLKGRDGDTAAAERLRRLEVWSQDRWAWLTGRDVPTEATRDEWPEGKPIIWTVDERDDSVAVKPYPTDKPFLRHLTEELWRWRVVGIDKTRQLYVSTNCMLNADHYARFTVEREIFVSKKKEALAVKLIEDKIRTVHRRLPLWLQEASPMKMEPMNVIQYLDSGSTVTAVAENFGEADARGSTASLVIVDESAFQPMFPSIYQAIMPMASRLWFITTANIGNPGAALSKKLLTEGRPA